MRSLGQADNMKVLLKGTTQPSRLVVCNDAFLYLVVTLPG
jgi:hypothetical protein